MSILLNIKYNVFALIIDPMPLFSIGHCTTSGVCNNWQSNAYCEVSA